MCIRDRVCQISGGTVNGNIVSTGGIISLTNGTTVSGNLQISGTATGTGAGQSHVLCSATVGNDLQFQAESNPLTIGGSSCGTTSVGGNLQIQSNTSKSLISATYTGVHGNVQVQSNAGTVVLEYDRVGNDMQVTSNTNSVVASYNTVNGNLQIQNNTSSSQVFGNTIKGNLQCNGNSTITGGGNTAPSKQGQCSAF